MMLSMTIVSPISSSPRARWIAARPDTPVPVGERATSPSAKMQTLREWAPSESGKPVKKVVNQLKKSDGFGAIRHDLLIGKTLEFLRENATLIEIEPEEVAAEAAAAAEGDRD